MKPLYLSIHVCSSGAAAFSLKAFSTESLDIDGAAGSINSLRRKKSNINS